MALGVLAALALPAVAACSGTGGGGAEAQAAAPPTAEVTEPVTAPTTPPTTAAPSTTAAPATTSSTTTTTTLPTATLPPGPWNIEPIEPIEPLPAVGTSSGEATRRIQQRLQDLNFWVGAIDGQYGLTTSQAVMAFQKYTGLRATGSVDEATAAALAAATEQAHATADAGTLAEVDKTRQLLFFVVDGRTQWIFNASTANGLPYEEEDQNTPGEIQRGVAITPNGLHRVNRERPEGWWEGDLGKIYRPKYFVGGVAVHGSNHIPNYPASHGCVRVSVPAMDFIWESGLMPMRMPVWVHGEFPGHQA